MSIFSKEVAEAAGKVGGDWIKAAEFEAPGLVLQVDAPSEIVKSMHYGAVETDWLVRQEIIHEGESMRYFFKDASGNQRKHDSKSAPFFLAFKQVDGLEVGDWVKVSRTGKADKTRYTVEKTDAPKKVTSEITADDIPF